MKKKQNNNKAQALLWSAVAAVTLSAAWVLFAPSDAENRAEYFLQNHESIQQDGNILPVVEDKENYISPSRGTVSELEPEVVLSKSISLRCVAKKSGLPIPFMGRVSGDEVADKEGVLLLDRKVVRRRPTLYLGGWVPQRLSATVQDGDVLLFDEATASLVVSFDGVQPDWKLVQSHLYFPKLPQIKSPPWGSVLQGSPSGRLLGFFLPEGVCTVSVTLSAPGRQHWSLTKSGVVLRAGERAYLTLYPDTDTYNEE